ITNEIVRQLMEQGGFYSLDRPGEFITVVDVQLVAAMIHPGGGRNDIPERLKRHFSIFNCTLPSNSSIDKIFGTVARGHFCPERGFPPGVCALASALVPTTRRVWQAVKAKMLPSPAKFHYIFNLRDLSRIWQGILTVRSEVCQSSELLSALFHHECCRVIADRFIDDSDRKTFNGIMEKITVDDHGKAVIEHAQWDSFFVDFLREAPEATGDEPEDGELEAPKVYEPIPSLDVLAERLSVFQLRYNETVRGGAMDLVFFMDVGEELDPVLDNILDKNYIKSGSTYKVKVGDKEVDVMKGFTLYITTKLANPAYSPEVSARTAVVDFTVTQRGLEDQLLGRVILLEKQELEAERGKLLEEVTSNKRKMQELEDSLLFRLTSTQGSLVEDQSLIEVLRVTKTTALEVSEKLSVAAETELKINQAREEYRPVATRGGILYFLIVEMSLVNIMYQTSLRQFLGLFDSSMLQSAKSQLTSKRISNIISFLTYKVYCYTARSLYEEHKLLFTLLLALKIALQARNISHPEVLTFVKGGASLDLNSVESKPRRWILDQTWLNLVQLSSLQPFSQILTQVIQNERAWRAWFDHPTPEDAPLPDGYEEKLDTFRKLLLIRSWCPDRTTAQARRYISDSLGPQYAEGLVLDLDAMLAESASRTPMVCLLSMGSDPTENIERLAKNKGAPCRSISMGQGQEVHARRLLASSMTDGGWLLLQNCHLGLDFLPELLETVTTATADSVHKGFRVWLTTDVHERFPITFLQSSIKFTNEPPLGMKAGLKRTFSAVTQDQLEISSLPQWKPLLYAVAFLHTTVQERRKFGPLGWNIPYEFNQADFTSSMQFVQNHLDDLDSKRGVDWSCLRYMLGEVQYGGRVTDDLDKCLLNTFTGVWFSESTFSDTFCFYTGYSIPGRARLVQDVLQHIDTLPLVDSPEVFGLHPNADITYQTNLANETLRTIISIQPKDSGGGAGETREASVQKLAAEMLEKLPPDYVQHEVKGQLKKMGPLQPMNIFLRQEVERMQRVIGLVRSTLTDLKLAIDGTIIMSEDLRDALDCMFDARVPRLWLRPSWPSASLGFWFSELLERSLQLRGWISSGRPDTFWLTGFFNPQGFLTAMRQETTRSNLTRGWALDTVTLSNNVTKMMKEDVVAPPPEEVGGVYIYGLFLDGAGWDRRGTKLCEAPPKVLFSPLPVVHVFAISSANMADSKLPPGGGGGAADSKLPPAGGVSLYSCPVYKKPRRTDLNFIFFLQLRSLQPPQHWTLRGAALLCDCK
ncbi:LOW QUALITY PROTEIN: dynein heavy chain 5, axonemal-like, partial [Notothenia coriiceps]|uniref:LOW QUALITY PROTEIN: dynein heavy chain 5, axonemal-like n=1 Tax=Notothenia coriiceps TaxID=8208 RepID=A0A6I9MI12_9TELE